MAGKKGSGTSPAAGGQGSYTGHQPTLPNVSLDDEEDPRKPFSMRGAEMDGYGASGRDEKHWAPDMPPGAEDYHGYGPPPMPLYNSGASYHTGPPPQRVPSYPLQGSNQQRIPDSYASSSTLGSYDLHSQPPLDAYAQNNAYYPNGQHEIQRSYSPAPSMYTSPPPPTQPIDYYSTDVSGSNQHRRNPTQESGTSSGEGVGAGAYARQQHPQDGFYSSPSQPPPRTGSMHALDGQTDPNGQRQGYPSDYKGVYRP